MVVDGEGGGWVANKINELALVEGNLPSSLVMVLLCALMHARQWRTSCFHLTNFVHPFMQNCFCYEIHITIFSTVSSLS